MTNEQRFLVRVLSDHLNRRKTEPCDELDWNTVASYAKIHQVSGILYHQCAAFLPESIKPTLQERHASELFYYYNREAMLARIAGRLSEKGIPFFVVKGLEVAPFYPIPGLRTMGDCDIVVHPEDREPTHEIMIALGFENRQKNDLEWMYWQNQMEVEIHSHLLYNEAGNTQSDREMVDDAWEYARLTGKGSRYALDWSYHFFFLLMHLKKHLIHAGVGFRQFMDLAVVLQHCELDWDWIDARLASLGLTDFAATCFALLERWFDISAPHTQAELSAAFYDEATVKVFANGIFGYDDAENHRNAQMRRLAAGDGPRTLARARYLLGMLFPPYRNMRCVPQYAFLDGRPWLLPVGWIYRFYHTLRYKNRQGNEMIARTFIPDDMLDARERELAKWGL